jgi:thiol-disulfide isomerase/thioredoxin
MKPQTWLALLGASLLTLTLAASIGAAIAGDAAPFGRGSWTELRKAHAGRPVIVHFWGLTCAPCLAELPEWGKLAHERAGLDLVLVHAERLAGDPSRITSTLAKAGLDTAESWMFADAFEEKLRFEIDSNWQGEMPRTLLIGRDGAVTALAGTANMIRVRSWLDEQAQAGGASKQSDAR